MAKTPEEKKADAEAKKAAAQLKKDEAKAAKDAAAKNAPLDSKVKIDIALLTEIISTDSEAQVELKKVYQSYYKQNPHRAEDELEKSQLLANLEAKA